MTSELAPADVKTRRHIVTWLGVTFALVVLMVAVGGITRLTGSGLSMVDWQPIIGWVPPLGEAQWQQVFERYQSSPQYFQVNSWMALDDFKRIFFWEYVHRVLGRVVFFAALVPFLLLTLGRSFRRVGGRRLLFRAGMVPLLIALQGVLGWFMVQSGLTHIPEVSHFRLAAHLTLAFFIAQWILWTALDLVFGARPLGERGVGLWRATWGVIALVTLQVVYGAFMAGTKAGFMFPTFPDVGGHYLPGPFFSGDLTRDLLYSPAAIHYLHRALGYLVGVTAAALCWTVLRRAPSEGTPGHRARPAAWLLAGLVAMQITLGVLTVVLHVPISLAVLHQTLALLLLSSAVLLLHALPAPDTAPVRLPLPDGHDSPSPRTA